MPLLHCCMFLKNISYWHILTHHCVQTNSPTLRETLTHLCTKSSHKLKKGWRTKRKNDESGADISEEKQRWFAMIIKNANYEKHSKHTLYRKSPHKPLWNNCFNETFIGTPRTREETKERWNSSTSVNSSTTSTEKDPSSRPHNIFSNFFRSFAIF